MEISPVKPQPRGAPQQQQPFMNQGSNSAPQSLYPQQFSQNVYAESLDKSKDFYVPLGQNSNGPVSRVSISSSNPFLDDHVSVRLIIENSNSFYALKKSARKTNDFFCFFSAIEWPYNGVLARRFEQVERHSEQDARGQLEGLVG